MSRYRGTEHLTRPNLPAFESHARVGVGLMEKSWKREAHRKHKDVLKSEQNEEERMR